MTASSKPDKLEGRNDRALLRSFELQPTLIGKLIELRPLRADDFGALLAAAGDPLIWAQHPESDRWKPEVFQRYFDSAMASKGAFAVIERKTGKFIGSSRYHDFRPSESEIEIGFTFLERKFWGGEYNRELKSLMLTHAFKFVERVVFAAGENNMRSRKALEKIGAKFLRMENRAARDGSSIPHAVYAISRKGTGEQSPKAAQ